MERNNKGNQLTKEVGQPIIDEWIEEYWIALIEKFGLVFKEYSFAPFPEMESGVHCLIFEATDEYVDRLHIKKFEGKEYEELVKQFWTEGKLVQLDDILQRDDDSQPAAQYRMYLGTLFVFIPYFE